MHNHPSKQPRYIVRRSRNGAAMIFILLLLFAMIMLSAVAINTAHLQLVRTELKIATDATARAAGRVYSMTGDETLTIDAAKNAAGQNLVNGQPFKIKNSDIEFGEAVRYGAEVRYDFTPTAGYSNAVRVMGRIGVDTQYGSVPLMFPLVSGYSSIDASTESISTQVELDIALVLDRSGSMAYADTEQAVYPPKPSAAPDGWDFGDNCPPSARWLDAIDATRIFLTELSNTPQNELVSMCTYADAGNMDVDLTDNYFLVLSGLDSYSSQFDGGGTNIEDGIRRGINALASSSASRPWASKVILVMTDGHVTVGGNPKWIAENAANQGIAVFTITFSDEADQVGMAEVADYGKGKHFHARDRNDLLAVFREIGRHLPTILTE